MIPITVHVPERRVEEFYVRFGEFVADVKDPESPARLPSGTVPSWALDEDASVIAAKLWGEMSLPGQALLTHLSKAAESESASFTPEQLAKAISHPRGVSGIAGIFGGVGKAIRRAGLPMYLTPRGADWHYVWDWDGERYSMTPEVAKLLREASRAR